MYNNCYIARFAKLVNSASQGCMTDRRPTPRQRAYTLYTLYIYIYI